MGCCRPGRWSNPKSPYHVRLYIGGIGDPSRDPYQIASALPPRAQPAVVSLATVASGDPIPSTTCMAVRESRSPEPRLLRSCTKRRAIRFLGSVFDVTTRCCSSSSYTSTTSSTSPTSTWVRTLKPQRRLPRMLLPPLWLLT